ncbi:DUF4345 family protein [Hymenobacter terrenus]|uniref:DUF4345 family protein n=1 Tax=Hymenobacter terrenus TaxID=1629124 RepID=UPI000907FE96|nr:DUF4345 family protein [Hymenobacter terrenus]
MKVTKILNTIGCVITIGFGLLGFLFPAQASKLTGLVASTASAVAEFRGTFGGAFLAAGIYPLIVRKQIVYLFTGLFWWGAAAGRILSLFADQGFDDPRNFGGLLIEVLFGLLLVVGNLRVKVQKELPGTVH